MVDLPAGLLDKRVTVRRLNPTATVDAAGHIDETAEASWSVLGKRWVQLIPRGSREFFRGQQVAAEITHAVRMRYDSGSKDYTTAMQLVLGTRKLNLAGPGVNTEEANVELVFPAIEVK